ncbi:MAG: hypothetical protein ABI729_03215 [Chitinophagales bacterium]
MRNPDIDTTFAAIRQAPMEVDFESMQQFVLQQPALSSKSLTDSKKWFNGTNVTILIVALSALIAAWLFTHNMPEENLPGTTSVSYSDQKTNTAEEFIPQKSTTPEIKKPIPTVSPKQVEKQSNPVLFTDVKKTASLMHPPSTATKPSGSIPDQTMNNMVVPEKQEQDTTPIRVRTYTSNYCTFDGEDVWIKAFLKALISDHIIKDSVELNFTLTLISFRVNGVALDEQMVGKYNQLYTTTTQKSLNSKSQISLSVGGSSCTLTKVIDD